MPVELSFQDVGTGPVVVLLHAFPLTSAMWSSQRDALAPSFRVITPDLRGFGTSPLDDGPPDLAAMADDVAALLDALGIDTAVVGGLSMGGYVTLALLRRFPDRVRGVVLADTKASADSPEAAANRERIATTVLAGPSSPLLLDELVPTLIGATTKRHRPAVVERVRAQVAEAPAAAVAWAQRAMAVRPDSFDLLRTLRVPLLVVVGEEDALSPVLDASAMVDAAATARLVVIPGAGHLSAVEAPEQFTAALADFLRAL